MHKDNQYHHFVLNQSIAGLVGSEGCKNVLLKTLMHTNPPKREMKEEGEKKNEYFYFCFMRARRSATEVSFSIFASLLPKV